jgi:hypothetical protein
MNTVIFSILKITPSRCKIFLVNRDFSGLAGLLRAVALGMPLLFWIHMTQERSLEFTSMGVRKIIAIMLRINIKQAISNDYDVPQADATYPAGKFNHGICRDFHSDC